MPQPRNEPVPDEGDDVPKVRPQGAMCMALQALGDLRYAAARGIEQDIVAALGNLGATRPTSLFEIRIFFWAQLKANHKSFSIAVGSGQNRLEERRIAFLIFLFEGLLILATGSCQKHHRER